MVLYRVVCVLRRHSDAAGRDRVSFSLGRLRRAAHPALRGAGRRGLLDGVCISGGEPLLQAELPQLLEQIKAMGYLVKLDTNGSQPEKLPDIRRSTPARIALQNITSICPQSHQPSM